MTPDEPERVRLSALQRHLLRQHRKTCGLRGKVLARELGVTLGAFNKYEAGERRPTRELLTAWQAALTPGKRT